MTGDPLKRFQKKITVDQDSNGHKLFDFLANSITPQLSKATWKKCIEAGGVWLKNPKEKKRLKRVTTVVKSGDILEIFFDPKAISGTNPNSEKLPELIYQQNSISVWNKPINMLTQPSPYGDDNSLLSYVSKKIKPSYLIHRLDRETEGLVMFAHSKEMAAKLNVIFSEHLIQKKYFALVVGTKNVLEQKIDLEIEDKNATTLIEMPTNLEIEQLYQKFPETKTLNASWVKLLPITGRKHQLRIHLQSIKRPLIFDPRYSRTHKKDSRLYLIAYALQCHELNLDLKLF